jgi:hypothetical protein
MKSSLWKEKEEMYVTGVVAKVNYNSSKQRYSLTLENAFQVYNGYLAAGLPSVEVGDIIVAGGKSTIYNGSIYELSNIDGHYPTIYKIIRKNKVIENDDPNFNNHGFPIIEVDMDDYNVVLIGIYNTKEEVAIYLHLFKTLPSNYKTKSQFNKSDYTSQNKLSTGGDRFYNKEGLLPNASNRLYYEADIDYAGGGRNAKRIVYSNDSLIFYTSDHYASFSIMKVYQ